MTRLDATTPSDDLAPLKRFGPKTAALFTAGGFLWVLASLVGGDDGSTRFTVSEVVWTGSHLALLAATFGLWELGLHRPGRSSAGGFVLAGAGRGLFVVAELIALAAGTTQDDLLPVAALTTALGTVVVGVSILRTERWHGPTRLLPLAVGGYPFVAMFPLAATSADGPPTASLVGWGLVTTAAGLGLATAVSAPTPRSRPR